jgi:hypothetical protein
MSRPGRSPGHSDHPAPRLGQIRPDGPETDSPKRLGAMSLRPTSPIGAVPSVDRSLTRGEGTGKPVLFRHTCRDHGASGHRFRGPHSILGACEPRMQCRWRRDCSPSTRRSTSRRPSFRHRRTTTGASSCIGPSPVICSPVRFRPYRRRARARCSSTSPPARPSISAPSCSPPRSIRHEHVGVRDLPVRPSRSAGSRRPGDPGHSVKRTATSSSTGTQTTVDRKMASRATVRPVSKRCPYRKMFCAVGSAASTVTA